MVPRATSSSSPASATRSPSPGTSPSRGARHRPPEHSGPASASCLELRPAWAYLLSVTSRHRGNQRRDDQNGGVITLIALARLLKAAALIVIAGLALYYSLHDRTHAIQRLAHTATQLGL